MGIRLGAHRTISHWLGKIADMVGRTHGGDGGGFNDCNSTNFESVAASTKAATEHVRLS